MARIRQFKPGFFTDDKVGRLSRDARLFFFGVLSEADDEGRLVDAPKRLAGVIFPFDEDVTPKKVTRWIDELEAQQIVLRYSHEKGSYLYIRKFKDHQKMSHPTPSSLPPPPSERAQSSGASPETLRNDSGEPPESFAPEGVFVFEGVSEGLVEGVSVSEGVSSSSSVVNHHVGSATPDDDDEESTTKALIADRRIAATTKVINNPAAYRARTLENVEFELGISLRRMLAEGMTPEAVADELCPRSAPPAAEPVASREQLPPVFDEVFVDGEWQTVRVVS